MQNWIPAYAEMTVFRSVVNVSFNFYPLLAARRPGEGRDPSSLQATIVTT